MSRMEELASLKKGTLTNRIQAELLGEAIKRTFIIKTNSENLAKNGEICFPANLLAWRGLIRETDVKNSSNVLEYYLRGRKCDTLGLSEQEILQKASELLVIASEKWSLKIEKALLRNDRVCLFLKRKKLVESSIKDAIKSGADYGRSRMGAGKSVRFTIKEDCDSELTTARLRTIKEVCERVFSLRGFKIVQGKADFQYLLTTKSHERDEDNYRRCVCGVVKNQNSNGKETSLTWSAYKDGKMKELTRTAEDKRSAAGEVSYLENIVRAIITFELLSVKPSQPVLVPIDGDPDRRVSSSKGGSFVLYNAARISAILQKFKEEACLGNYPELPDIDDVNFDRLKQEEEWELVYNFILEYPEMIENCIRNETSLEMSLQAICLFLSRLSKKFSVYYRRTRILTEGRDHLVPTMMARLYLLRALQVVVNNSLYVLNITPVDTM